MKSVKVNAVAAAAAGMFNLFSTQDENTYILAIVHQAGHFIVPIIGDKAYVSCEEETVEETVASLVEGMVNEGIYPCLTGVAIKFRAAPAHNQAIKGSVYSPLVNAAPEVEDILQKEGYTFVSGIQASGSTKDYAPLLAAKPEAKAMLESTKEILSKVGATYESLSLRMKMAYEGMMHSENSGVILTGPTGTGKSWISRICSVHAEAPLITQQVTYGTTVEDLIGMFIPNASEDASSEQEVRRIMADLGSLTPNAGEETGDFFKRYQAEQAAAMKKIDGIIAASGGSSKWKFVPGTLLRAWADFREHPDCYGCQICLDEINYGQPGVLACINQFTDGTERIIVNGVTYTKSPNFVVYMTMNPGYEGTEVLNMALKNRFSIVDVPALTKEQFTERMIGYSKSLGHALSKDFFYKLFDFAGKMEVLGKGSGYHENLAFSIRNAQRLCDIVLLQPRDFESFKAALSVQYIDVLSCDNDNSAKVEELRKNPDINAKIQEIFDSYDCATMNKATSLMSLEDVFQVGETDSDNNESTLNDADLDELFKNKVE
jgi:MoxR-like ATPase